jgi:hypothetical protein
MVGKLEFNSCDRVEKLNVLAESHFCAANPVIVVHDPPNHLNSAQMSASHRIIWVPRSLA